MSAGAVPPADVEPSLDRPPCAGPYSSEREVLPEAVIDAAITWAVKLDYGESSDETRRAFERWLQTDPLHVIAWQRMGVLGNPFGAVPRQLVRTTLQAADNLRQRRRLGRRDAMKLLSLAGLALGAGWTAREYSPWQRLLADAATAIGEQKTLRLADGTLVMLNTDTAINTDFSGDRRMLVLRRGEMLVATGADALAPAQRPFWVYTPFGRLRALGTRFTVRLEDQRARINVQEGAVELHPSAGATPWVVRRGESRWLADGGTAEADLKGFEPDGWAEGVIAGKNIRLGDLLAELARYRRGFISCDERIGDLRISGFFHIRNTDQALRFLAQTQPVSVTYRTGAWVLVGPKRERG